ncbi:hypothetical protein GGD53_006099 [Rhizobium aethiopicum]|uniref:Uncharacterized protein n=1 Tax=Rhizobium aethiopicum TaxID=1138170 RepID=A0A7W6VSU8_9HYPH|nr:hypothetical protein [Rhizobium aethiopicum]
MVAAEQINVLASLVEVVEQADVEAPAASNDNDISPPCGAEEDRLAKAFPGNCHIGIGRRLAGRSFGDEGEEGSAPRRSAGIDSEKGNRTFVHAIIFRSRDEHVGLTRHGKDREGYDENNFHCFSPLFG